MTLIVGLHCDDHLLLAADSGAYDDEDDSVTLMSKLEYAGSFAWGFSGYVTPGDEFNAWMRSEHQRLAAIGNGLALIDEVQQALNRVNAEPLQDLQHSGSKGIPYNRFAHGVVVTYVGSSGVIFTVQYDRPANQYASVPGRMVRIGVEDYAENAQEVLLREGRWTLDQHGLQRLMDSAIVFGKHENLRPPVRMLRVNRGGLVEDVSNEDFRKRFPR